jgi:hypothetical protein
MVVTIREQTMAISRSGTVLVLKGKAGKKVATRVTVLLKGIALTRAKKEAGKEMLKARILVSGQTQF